MRVFVTGINGYIGALLGPMLMSRGHEVVGLDTGYYRDGWLYHDAAIDRFPQVLSKDLRQITEDDLRGFDGIVHLAELSNDPLGQNRPETTYAINHLGSVRLASAAKHVGVERFVYTSSCSVYGVGTDDVCTEESETRPQTAYAHCKVLVEQDVSRLASDGFSPTFLRNATAYGASPSMRFDIVLNNLCGLAWTQREIRMTSDGTPWRPLVHVLDICDAIACTLEAPREVVHNEVLNVGATRDNYRVREVAALVQESFPECEIVFGSNGADNRSYRVSFDKIHERLPRFSCRWSAASGARQLRALFERIDLSRETFELRPYTRLRKLEYLIRTEQVDADLYWRPV
jgi:nucleoside-diphosphate-sugar epimerase